VLVEKKIEKALLEAIQTEIDQHYKSTPQSLETNYMQIINETNFDRLQPYLNGNEIYCGGVSDRETRFISPTVLNHITFEDAIMQDEIFGPILPVIAFENLDEVIQKVKAKQKPLSLYIYSKNRNTIKKILHEISFGGGAINDSMMHLSNSKLPFGGVGYSGMGSYTRFRYVLTL
jgi:aldehyde dehydrogenase (NAD+)